MGIPNYLTFILRNLCAGQEETVRTRNGTMGWVQIGKGKNQSCMLSPCLFNLYAVYTMWTARLDEAHAWIKIAGRNINNFRYADDTALMAESKDELPRSVGVQYATGNQWRNNSRKNEETEPKQQQHSAVDVTGDGSKVWYCKAQYCIGAWNVRSMNQGKLEVVKQQEWTSTF